MATELPEYVQRNRSAWDDKADAFGSSAPSSWAREEPTGGEYNLPDAQPGTISGSAPGMDVIDLGCGTGYFSSWMTRKGGRTVGIDTSPKQLEAARRKQEQLGI